jgi:hypothetical protein
MNRPFFAILALVVALPSSSQADAQTPALPSWNEGATKSAITGFVARVTEPGGPDYVAPAERIAVFDNDGTLWAEQPMYVQLAFALDRVKALAPLHPGWKQRQPFKAVLEGDSKTVFAGGEHALLELVMASQAEFMRPWTEEVYGIPPEQVIGSSIETRFELRDAEPVLVRLPEIDFIDDKAGKPVGIHRHIGRRPIAAFGNSDGDLQMLQWVAGGNGRRLCVYIHHTDAEREWMYDRESSIGRLDEGLDEARLHGWTVVHMKRDWGTVFPSTDADVPASGGEDRK